MCQPGREEVTGAAPRLVFVNELVRGAFMVDDGRSNDVVPRAPFVVVVGREVLIGREVVVALEPELNAPRAATAFVPVRGAEKKRCVLDGACR